MDETFRTAYPNTPNAELARRFHVSPTTIAGWARRLGLRKNDQYRRAVQASNASKRRLSAEQRAHLSEVARQRAPQSPDSYARAVQTKRERGTLLRGASHPSWKGGHPWERFKDPAYISWRNAVLARDEYQCQRCGRQCAKHERGLAAHHIKAYATHPQLRLDVSNGMTLCRDCHMTIHNKKLAPAELIACACGCGTLIAAIDRYGRPRRFVNYHGGRAPRGGRKWEPVSPISCACGCGETLGSHDRQGRPRRFVNGHGARGVSRSAATREKLARSRRGRALTPEHRRRVSEGLRRSPKRIGRPPKPR